MKKNAVLAFFALIPAILLLRYGDQLGNTIKVQTFLANLTPGVGLEEQAKNTTSTPGVTLFDRYSYELISQGDKIVYMEPGEEKDIEITIKNIGKEAWNLEENSENRLSLGTYFPEGRQSAFFDEKFIEVIDAEGHRKIEENGELTFEITFHAPEISGVYQEGFLPFVSGQKWLNNEKISWDIVVGDDFSDSYDYEMVSPAETILPINKTQTVFFQAKNTGKISWYGKNTFPVKFTADSLEANLMETVVVPGGTGTFSFDIAGGSEYQCYNFKFQFAVADLYTMEENPLLWNITVSDKVVALTFDDGYGDINPFIDTLNEEGVRATFFILGDVAEDRPTEMKRIVEEGHLLANHSYIHPDFRTLSADSIRWELEHTREIMKEITGYDVYPYFRYPYGASNSFSDSILAEDGWKYFHWTNGTGDYKFHENSAHGREHVYYFATLNPPDQAIVLMHIISQSTLAVLPDIIDFYRNAGYAFVTVDQL